MVSAAAECVRHESEVRTWPVWEVTLSALLAADLCLSDVTAAAAAESVAAAHPGAAPPDPVHSLQSVCPCVADPVCLALKGHGPTPSPGVSSSSSARLPLYPSSCRLPSVKEMIEDYRTARYE
jgi:hypothetical protein